MEFVKITLLHLLLLYAISTVGCFREGDIRLVPVNDFTVNRTGFGGRLELFSSRNEWTAFCVESSFDLYEADIACKQLGFLYVNKTGTTKETANYLFKGLLCRSKDTRLGDCTKTLTRLSCVSDAAVTLECTNSPSPVRLRSESGRTTDLSAGILEIFIDDKWGTVCDDLFTITEAHVACRQLGFLRANSYTSVRTLGYPRVSAPIWLDDVNCTSTRGGSDLRLCKHDGIGEENCSNNEDVFISCIGTNSVRLRNRRTSKTSRFETSGVLEIYWDGAWGSVCYEPSFTLVAAEIACRRMGLVRVRSYGSAQTLGYTSSSSSSPELILSGVVCNSSKVDNLTSILNCNHDGLGFPSLNCSSSVGISCSSTYIPSTRGTTDPPSSLASGLAIATMMVFSVVIFIFVPVIVVYKLTSKKRSRRAIQSSGQIRNINLSSSVPSNAPQLMVQRPYPAVLGDAGDHYHMTATFASNSIQKKDMSASSHPEPSYKESELHEAPPPSYEAAMQYPAIMTSK